MAYEWQKHECYDNGVPFSKGHMARLEKDGVTYKFKTQEAVDQAWADGWYEPGRPETADVARETSGPDEVKLNGNFADMNRNELIFMCEKHEVEYDKRWGPERLREVLRNHFPGDG